MYKCAVDIKGMDGMNYTHVQVCGGHKKDEGHELHTCTSVRWV